MNRLERFDQALRARRPGALLVGVDEAGRGPLAGPVVAAAVLLPARALRELDDVRDSKSMTPRRREAAYAAIRAHARAVGVGWASPADIDRDNILQATFAAMRRAVARLGLAPGGAFVAVDGDKSVPRLPYPQMPLVDGDVYSLSIASASVVAKVVRDRWMASLDRRWPDYGFARHKGYGTAEHLAALRRLGPSPLHRRSFAPVAQALLPL